jgi:integrase
MAPDGKHNLMFHGRVYWFKLSIPPKLREHFPSKTKPGADMREIQINLGTDSLSAAQRERDRLLVEYRDRFEALASGASVSSREVEQIAAAYRERRLEEERKAAAEREGLRPREIPDQEYWAIVHKWGDEIHRIGASLNPPREIPPKSAEFIQLGRALEAVDVALRRPEPPPRIKPLEQTTAQTPPVSAPIVPVSSPAMPVAPAGGETFGQAFAEYLGRIKRKKSGVEAIASHENRARLFASFLESVGAPGWNTPVAAVSREHAAAFVDRAKRLSSDWSRNAKGLSFAEIEARHGGKGELADRTVNRYVQTLFGTFRFAKDRGTLLGPNPFLEMQRTITEQEAEAAKREIFTDSELVRLFASRPLELAPAQYTVQNAMPWIALIAAYSGARLEEIAQLAAADVREVEGVLCLDLHRGNGNKIKTKAGVRFVPVHSALVAAGLLKYRDALPKGSRLFPGLSNENGRGKFSKALSGAFNRKPDQRGRSGGWLAQVGLARPGLVFHSFRHTVRTKLRNARYEESFVHWITGHEQGNVGANYGNAPSPKVLAEAIEKIRYEGLEVTAT